MPTRAALVGGAVLLLFLAVGFTFWAATPDFVQVYAGSPTQAQALAKELDKASVPYRLSEDGAMVSVRRPDAGRARQLGSGVVRGADAALGLRGMDTMGPFTTYEQQRVRIERAQEEALEEQLAQYAGVEKAVVNLAIPLDNARVGEEVPPKAAVTLTPLLDHPLDEAQVAAMASVVAHSVPNLLPENVTIASSLGTTLWSKELIGGADNNNTLKTRTKAEKEFIRTRQAELQSSLDRVFGPNKALVYVDATLDLDKQETDAKRVLPVGDGKGLLVSQTTSSEQYAGTRPPEAAGGPVGMDANIPGYPAARASTSGGGTYKKTDEIANYDNSTEAVRTIKAVGEPKRLNVSAMVDDKLPVTVQNAVRTWLEGSVVNQVNKNTTTVSVVPAPFNTGPEVAAKAARAALERQALLTTYAPYIVLPFCLGVLLLAAWLLTRRKPDRLVVAAPELALAGGPGRAMPLPGARVEEMLEGKTAEQQAALEQIAVATALEGTKMQSIEDKTEPELDAILDFVDKRPETAALLLRSWTGVEVKKG